MEIPEDEINSNLFKKNSLYPNLCGALRGRFSSQDGGWDQEAHTLAERLAELLGFPAVSDQSPAALRTPPFPAAAGVQELPLEAVMYLCLLVRMMSAASSKEAGLLEVSALSRFWAAFLKCRLM